MLAEYSLESGHEQRKGWCSMLRRKRTATQEVAVSGGQQAAASGESDAGAGAGNSGTQLWRGDHF